MNNQLISMFQSYCGKETIDMNTYGKSSGRSGNYSTNYQISGRELMTPDEVRLLNNKYAILFIRGERPIIDYKYDILKHPNVAYTTDGKSEPYIHGSIEHSTGIVTLNSNKLTNQYMDIEKVIETKEYQNIIENYKLYSEQEIEEMIIKGEL